jgi:hypothetical protein
MNVAAMLDTIRAIWRLDSDMVMVIRCSNAMFHLLIIAIEEKGI